MLQSCFIRKSIAAFLILVFAFSITPTIVLHNWFANHTDTCTQQKNSQSSQISSATFHCHCNSMVAVSAFTEPGQFEIAAVEKVFNTATSAEIVQPTTSLIIFHALRGPPTV
ncbi:MAG: hypothetical protein KF825_00740 [Ferruginibacter sp.]|nr:hypothetical protein [Ferruginibacter sp.]